MRTNIGLDEIIESLVYDGYEIRITKVDFSGETEYNFDVYRDGEGDPVSGCVDGQILYAAQFAYGGMPTCAECGNQFSADEWEDRHSDPDGEDIHARCCAGCNLDE